MAKFLVIAEKPSVAQSLAKNLSAYQTWNSRRDVFSDREIRMTR